MDIVLLFHDIDSTAWVSWTTTNLHCPNNFARAEKIGDEYREEASDNSLLPRGIVILLLTFSLTLDKSAGKLGPRPFFFFFFCFSIHPQVLSLFPCWSPHADDSAAAPVGNKEAARYRTSLNLKLKLIFSLPWRALAAR